MIHFSLMSLNSSMNNTQPKTRYCLNWQVGIYKTYRIIPYRLIQYIMFVFLALFPELSSFLNVLMGLTESVQAENWLFSSLAKVIEHRVSRSVKYKVL